MWIGLFLGVGLSVDVLPEGSRIVHGQLAETPEQYSFLVSIRLEYMPTNSLCAGALINSRTVVTAAHCNETDGIDRLMAYHGIFDFSDPEKVDASDPIRVVAFIQHPRYNPKTYFNDGT
ncbi:hypothetical protein DSO57_1023033 [Entomophthora muscae]|uniref:Uncharacterized protein n=1 Tax=Entomophthora muscae TaxID=34485 RepID=A0ACC2UCH2_9FUNG|nr:hypothetical protein DSO57_1023033 [Entomophthora muscae]